MANINITIKLVAVDGKPDTMTAKFTTPDYPDAHITFTAPFSPSRLHRAKVDLRWIKATSSMDDMISVKRHADGVRVLDSDTAAVQNDPRWPVMRVIADAVAVINTPVSQLIDVMAKRWASSGISRYPEMTLVMQTDTESQPNNVAIDIHTTSDVGQTIGATARVNANSDGMLSRYGCWNVDYSIGGRGTIRMIPGMGEPIVFSHKSTDHANISPSVDRCEDAMTWNWSNIYDLARHALWAAQNNRIPAAV